MFVWVCFVAMNEKTMTRRRFQYYVAAALCGFLPFDVLAAPLSEIPVAKSLQSEIAAALKIPSPLLVFVSLDNCPFCKIAKNNYLLPLMNEHAVPIVQVNFRHARVLSLTGRERQCRKINSFVRGALKWRQPCCF